MPLALKAGDSVVTAKKGWLDDIQFFKEKCHSNSKYVNVVSPLL